MKPLVWLRAAAVVGLLLALGHSRGAPWTPGHGAAAAVIEAMKTVPVEVMGAQRSYWDFYQGFGWCDSAWLFALSLALWQLGGMARQDARRLRPLLLTVAAAYAANGIIAWQYIFIVPLLFSAVIVGCILVAWVLAARDGAGAAA